MVNPIPNHLEVFRLLISFLHLAWILLELVLQQHIRIHCVSVPVVHSHSMIIISIKENCPSCVFWSQITTLGRVVWFSYYSVLSSELLLFKYGLILPPMKYLSCLEAFFVVMTRLLLPASGGERLAMLQTPYNTQHTLNYKELLAYNVNSAKAEKLWFKLSLHHLLTFSLQIGPLDL